MVENTDINLTEAEAELYDRQIRLWGLEAQKKLRKSKILIAGLNGLGAEVAKNIILSGVKSVTLLDSQNVTEIDNCSQFLVPVTSVGQNRAEASLQRARALNPMVEVTADADDITKKNEEFFEKFDVVVVSGVTTSQLVRIDNICRSKGIKFFSADVWGMFGYTFTDLQTHEFVEDKCKHKVISKPNEKVKTELVVSTAKGKLEFPPFQKVLDFDYNTAQYAKRMKRVGTAFPFLRVLQEFRDRHQRDPHYEKRAEDIEELKKIRDQIADTLVSDHNFETVFGQISPVAAIIGGELSQEIIKTISHKEAPNLNVFLFDPNTCSGIIEEIK